MTFYKTRLKFFHPLIFITELYIAGLKFDLSPAHIKTLMEFVNEEMEKL